MNDLPRPDGGPAFPVPDSYVETGMSLRDYIAIKAMAGQIAAIGKDGIRKDVLAKWSYEMADIMLTESFK